MADINEETKTVSGVYGGVTTEGCENNNISAENVEEVSNLPAKQGIWSKVKAFLFQEIDWNKEIKIELTPAQQKVEDEINAFLHQEITWEKVHDFLFQEITFGKKKNND